MAPSKEFGTVFRQKIVDAKKSGLSYAAVAKKFDVSKNAVVRIMKKFNDTGSVENKRGRGRKRKLTTRDDSMILREVKKNPQITVRSIKENLRFKCFRPDGYSPHKRKRVRKLFYETKAMSQ